MGNVAVPPLYSNAVIRKGHEKYLMLLNAYSAKRGAWKKNQQYAIVAN